MITFINSFLSYLLLFAIIVVIGICGGVVGKKLRDVKDSKNVTAVKEEE